jgi:hypothetical protein
MKKIQLAPMLVLIICFSCQKQPKASFSTDKTSYIAGETIHLKNESVNAHSYSWTLPDGQSSSTDIDYVIAGNEPTGTKLFKLKALSKNGKKFDECEQTVSISAAPAPTVSGLVFWNYSGGSPYLNPPCHITIDTMQRVITTKLTTAPDCSSTNCAVFKGLAPGIYNWYAAAGINVSNGTVTLTANSCVNVQVN